jgi:hypothetical protein
MKEVKKVLSQWSSLRGLVVMVAALVGINPVISGAGIELADVVINNGLPVLASAIGLYDVVRDDEKTGPTKKG